jgi:hypothetical protein
MQPEGKEICPVGQSVVSWLDIDISPAVLARNEAKAGTRAIGKRMLAVHPWKGD